MSSACSQWLANSECEAIHHTNLAHRVLLETEGRNSEEAIIRRVLWLQGDKGGRLAVSCVFLKQTITKKFYITTKTEISHSTVRHKAAIVLEDECQNWFSNDV